MPTRTGPAYKFDSEQEVSIVDAYLLGKSIRSMALELGVNEKTVSATLVRNGIALRGRRGFRHHLTTKTELTAMVRAYKSGSSTEVLAAQYGMSAGSVASRLKQAGVPLREPGFQQGEEHHNWKGGRVPTSDGKYMQVLVYPTDPLYAMAKTKSDNANGGRYILEHRYKMAQKLGRCLADNETVHHKDDNGLNNNLKNLQLRQGKHGKGASFRCCDCGSYNVEATALAG